MIERIIGDVRFAFRTLLKVPTFTVAVAVTITLAIGSTTAIFAVVDNILLRPLPFPESQLATLYRASPHGPESHGGVAPHQAHGLSVVADGAF